MTAPQKHRADAENASPWIARFAPLVRRDGLSGGMVLDVACGGGRHTRFFLNRDFPVVAVDRDVAGVADLAGRPDVEIVGADLEIAPWPLGARRFAAIVVANYLFRPLFPNLLAALEPGGALLYETFARGNERFGHPRNPDYLLKSGELLDIVHGRLSVVAYEHGRIERPRPAVIQRICAVNDLAAGASLEEPSSHLLPP